MLKFEFIVGPGSVVRPFATKCAARHHAGLLAVRLGRKVPYGYSGPSPWPQRYISTSWPDPSCKRGYSARKEA